jgi:hypothetical protein
MIEKKTLIASTFEQEAAVSPYCLVKLGTGANQVSEAADSAALIIGVADETSSDTINEEVTVIMSGIALVNIGSATNKGAAITGTTAGVGLATTTDNQYCVGYLLKTTTASNELAPVLISPFMYGTI